MGDEDLDMHDSSSVNISVAMVSDKEFGERSGEESDNNEDSRFPTRTLSLKRL